MIKRLGHLLAFILPVSTLLFLTSAPHGIASAISWTIPFFLLLLADWLCHDLNPQNNPNRKTLFYDGLLYALSVLQWVNVVLMLGVVSQLHWGSMDDWITSLVNLLVIRFLVGTSSGTSGIVVAHELIHRPQPYMQFIGRILLVSVCYEHFIITHKRGHHLSMGMPEDIATARLGESFNQYWLRVYFGHLHYAWCSEQDRLGLKRNDFLRIKIIENQVLQGILIELALFISIIYLFGWLAAFMFLYQALSAVRILEAVNYFQHWGLEDKPYTNSFGWVNDSPISRYALIGLSHHIGHHENDQKQYHEIAYSVQGPKMPYGYFVMNFWVKLNSASYQKMAVTELQRFLSKS